VRGHPFDIDSSSAPPSHSPLALAHHTGTKPEIVEAAYNSFLAEDCGAVVDGHPKCDDHDFAGTCMKYFLIIESHHDYCGPNDLPKDVEVGWHDLEDLGCHSCSITRQHNSALKDCPIVDCTDLGVLGAAWSVIEAGCEAGATGGGHDHAHRRLSGDDEGSAYEWSGAFAVDDATHVWNMQKVDGAYADLTMKLVLIPTSTTPDEATMHSLEETGETLIEGTCAVIEAGETMTPLTDGSCFELHVDADVDDSTFTIATSGIAGLVMFAQHVPTEFERTMHYLKDSAGVDIEAIAEEIAGTVACCETADQIGAWKVALAYHDFCGWELLPEKVEKGIHDFEGVCIDHGCNTLRASDPDPAVCVPEEKKKKGSDDDVELAIIVAAVLGLLVLLGAGVIGSLAAKNHALSVDHARLLANEAGNKVRV
jgi:hypothetical protein